MPPKLFNFGTQPLTANQPILSLSSARVFALSLSLSFSRSVSFEFIPLCPSHVFSSPLSLSRLCLHFSFLSVLFFFFPWISVLFAFSEQARSLPSKMTPSQIDKAREIYCCARSVATFAQVPCTSRNKEPRKRPGCNTILDA